MRTQAHKPMTRYPPSTKPLPPEREMVEAMKAKLVKAHAIPEPEPVKIEEIKVKRTLEQILHELPVEVRGGGHGTPFEGILTANGAKAVLAALKAED